MVVLVEDAAETGLSADVETGDLIGVGSGRSGRVFAMPWWGLWTGGGTAGRLRPNLPTAPGHA
jgi:hypothetical protein